MNNGRPNYGNQPAWGNTPQNQQSGYAGAPQMGQQPRYQQGYPQPGQQGQRQSGYQQPGYPPQGGQAFPQGAQPYQPYGQPVRPAQPPYPQQPYGYGQQRPPYPQQPYQGQPPYPPQGQMGYQQRFPQGQQPYPPQGYGYQQPPQPQRKPGVKPETLAMVVLCGVLPVLFVLSMVFAGVPALKWVFIGLTLLTVAVLWLKPLIAHNMRLTFSGVYGALAIVALVSVLTGAPADSTAPNAGNGGAGVSNQQTTGQTSDGVTAQQDGNLLGALVTEPTAAPPSGPSTADSAVLEQLESFFYFWSVNNQDNMLTLCAPSWQRSSGEPKKALFSILQNRKPLEWTVEKLSGTENDLARTATVTAVVDRQNGRDPQKYRFNVFLKQEDGDWYIDPASLESNETISTSPPTANDTATPPPAAAQANPNTVLYYNPDGGKYYHIDDNCPSADKKNLPFKGSFKYSEIDSSKYKDLRPCGRCGAPVRP